MHEFVVVLDTIGIETCGCHIECFRYPFERILLRTALAEFIAAQCRLADSIGGFRQRPLRHVVAHPNIPDAFSQKLFFTIAFRHFRTLANQRIKTRYRISKRMKMA